MWEICYYILASLTITLVSGFALSRFFGTHETILLEKQVNLLNNQMQQLLNKGNQLKATLHNEIFPTDNHYRAMLEIDTMPYVQRLAGTGGSAGENMLALQDNLVYQVDNLIDILDLQLEVESVSLDLIYKKAIERSQLNTHLPAILPVAEEDLTMISSDFGVRLDPFFFTERVHNGLDFVAPVGKNVYATGDGIVTFVKHSRTGYGNEIVIDHRFSFGSRYAHLDTILVKQGERVRRGQVIGTVGETGRATGPHLHYEVLHQKRPVNPSYYFDTSLTAAEYGQIISNACSDID